MALSTVSGGGTQTNTQNPQTSAAPASSATQSSSLQPGTTSSLLSNDSGGVPLTVSNLPTVSLSGNNSNQTVAIAPKPTHHHQANPILIGFAGALFLLAVVLFWLMSRSAKNTTKY